MKKVLFFILIFNITLFSAESGKILYEKNCLICHKIASVEEGPPSFSIRNYYIKAYAEREIFVKKMVQWLENPTKETSLIPRLSMKYGIMPKLSIQSKDLKLIAQYLYDNNFERPNWYLKTLEANKNN